MTKEFLWLLGPFFAAGLGLGIVQLGVHGLDQHTCHNTARKHYQSCVQQIRYASDLLVCELAFERSKDVCYR